MPRPVKTVQQRLAILADAAKYDASCASSGAGNRNSLKTGGIGSTEGMGICHAYAPDGRCISLLKILLTNACIYDCAYCINRVSSNVERAAFSPAEVADLTMMFYRRNYIEGLFLSSGIIRSSDYTMELMLEALRLLRTEHKFGGYIHLKTIPECSPELLTRAGELADRMSINVELPTPAGLTKLAPEKDAGTIRKAMGTLRVRIDDASEARKDKTLRRAKPPRFAPGGQSTQMIVGADDANDATILKTSAGLYAGYGLRRVYYSAFSPIPAPSVSLPAKPPPLQREHRLYQADWLHRFYGFEMPEIESATKDGMLDLDIDPKLAWALNNRGQFPVDVNRADKAMLLRIPGIGTKAVGAILKTRRHRRLRLADLSKMSRTVKRALPFLVAADWQPGKLLDAAGLEASLRKPKQLDMFAP
ncbi:MAG: putative DNA modification/repair radical SAM protein [Pseudomonadota bacterium]